MDQNKENIYKGFIMNITFIEDPITGGASIRSIIQDEMERPRDVLSITLNTKIMCLLLNRRMDFGLKCN